ncbi:MAG: YciI family protein [Streptosporangiaceae bacterium]
MRFLLLICGDQSAAAHAEDGCGGWTQEMVRRGLLPGADGSLATGGLRPPAEARTVRVRRRQLMLSDGPFAETKEQIAGFCILECAGLDEAVAAAAEHPAASYGTIEVRPMLP